MFTRVSGDEIVEPVTLTEAKKHLRVTHTSEDSLIEVLIGAAREYVEVGTGIALVSGTYSWTPEHGDDIAPLLPAFIESADGDVPILFTVIPQPIPFRLKCAILMIVADLYANREVTIKDYVPNQTALNLIHQCRRTLGVK